MRHGSVGGLASYPGSQFAREEKRAWYLLLAHAPKITRNLGTLVGSTNCSCCWFNTIIASSVMHGGVVNRKDVFMFLPTESAKSTDAL